MSRVKAWYWMCLNAETLRGNATHRRSIRLLSECLVCGVDTATPVPRITPFCQGEHDAEGNAGLPVLVIRTKQMLVFSGLYSKRGFITILSLMELHLETLSTSNRIQVVVFTMRTHTESMTRVRGRKLQARLVCTNLHHMGPNKPDDRIVA